MHVGGQNYGHYLDGDGYITRISKYVYVCMYVRI
jgi:carotenoid cleavage dioxygenase-like enzyme